MTRKQLSIANDYYALMARDNFWIYRQFINPKLLKGWFIKELCYELQQWYVDYKAGKNPKLIIQIIVF